MGLRSNVQLLEATAKSYLIAPTRRLNALSDPLSASLLNVDLTHPFLLPNDLDLIA